MIADQPTPEDAPVNRSTWTWTALKPEEFEIRGSGDSRTIVCPRCQERLAGPRLQRRTLDLVAASRSLGVPLVYRLSKPHECPVGTILGEGEY